jgi:hypothetical protein
MDTELDTSSDTATQTEDSDAPFDIGSALEQVAEETGHSRGGNKAEPVVATPEATKPSEGGQASTPPPEGTNPEGAGRRPPDLARAPASWKPEVAAGWASLTPEVRAEIHRREEDSARGVAEVKQVAEVGKRWQQALTPYAKEFAQYNIDPVAHAQTLFNAHRTLALGTPQEKQAMLTSLAREYKIQLPGGQATADEEPAWIDPQVKALQERVDQLQSVHESNARAASEQRRQQLVEEVTAFANDKAAHPHFDVVAEEIAQLMQASGGKMKLQDAYDKAVWLVPDVRLQLIAKQTADAKSTAEKAEADRAAAAAKARGLVKSSSKSVTDTGKLGKIDDTLKETFAAIQARSK